MQYASTIQKLAQNLMTTYDNTIFSHSGNVGDTREKEVIDYLTKVMPHKYGFQSGEIFDEDSKNSGQVDVIIYDNLFSTVFTDGSNKILAPVESTYGIISVKSKMGTKELDDAINGINRYNMLKRPKGEEGAVYLMPDVLLKAGKNISFPGTTQQNINCIFAFDTTVATTTIKQKITDAGCIDLLVIPGKLCAGGRNRSDLMISKDGTPLSSYVFESDKSIATFTLLLQLCLSRNKLIGGDLQKQFLWLIQQGNLLT